MVSLKDVRDDLREAKLLMDRCSAIEPTSLRQQIVALLDKTVGDLQDIEAAITQVIVFDNTPRGLSARSEPKRS